MPRRLAIAAVALPLLVALTGSLAAQGAGSSKGPGTAAPDRPAEAQPRALPAPSPVLPEGRKSCQETESGSESAPQQGGGGCRYFQRKLDLIV